MPISEFSSHLYFVVGSFPIDNPHTLSSSKCRELPSGGLFVTEMEKFFGRRNVNIVGRISLK